MCSTTDARVRLHSEALASRATGGPARRLFVPVDVSVDGDIRDTAGDEPAAP